MNPEQEADTEIQIAQQTLKMRPILDAVDAQKLNSLEIGGLIATLADRVRATGVERGFNENFFSHWLFIVNLAIYSATPNNGSIGISIRKELGRKS